jgi:hypothetical protein
VSGQRIAIGTGDVPAVDDELGPGAIRAVVAGQEQRQPRDLLRGAGPGERLARQDRVEAPAGLGRALRTIGVSMMPGWFELTRMPSGPSSMAAAFVMPVTANLLAT